MDYKFINSKPLNNYLYNLFSHIHTSQEYLSVWLFNSYGEKYDFDLEYAITKSNKIFFIAHDIAFQYIYLYDQDDIIPFNIKYNQKCIYYKHDYVLSVIKTFLSENKSVLPKLFTIHYFREYIWDDYNSHKFTINDTIHDNGIPHLMPYINILQSQGNVHTGKNVFYK